MRSMQYGPTATKDAANNFVFSGAFMRAYRHNLDPDLKIDAAEGTEFQFVNGPQGGGLKLVVVSIDANDGAVTARKK